MPTPYPGAGALPSVVSSIDGPAKADAAVSDLMAAIGLGALLPGQSCSLVELAEWYEVRPSSLERRFRSGWNGDLLFVRGDEVVATGLSGTELRSLHLVHAAVREGLFVHSFEQLPRRHLNRLAATVPLGPGPTDSTGTALVSFGDTLTVIQLALCEGRAGRTESRLLKEVQIASRRYYALGWAAAYGAAGSAHGQVGRAQQVMLERWREILVLAGAGRADLAADLLRRDAQQSLQIAEQSLCVDWDVLAGPVGVDALFGGGRAKVAGASMSRAISSAGRSATVVPIRP